MVEAQAGMTKAFFPLNVVSAVPQRRISSRACNPFLLLVFSASAQVYEPLPFL